MRKSEECKSGLVSLKLIGTRNLREIMRLVEIVGNERKGWSMEGELITICELMFC